MGKSILQTKRECLICKTTLNLQEHHVFEGRNRQNSEKWGMKVWLCMNHHTGDEGIHLDEKKNKRLKAAAQRVFEAKYGHDQFMKVFRRNYL